MAARAVVDFPHPDSPARPMILPASRSILTPDTTMFRELLLVA
jgi:hypothetical protein